jgi:hypothetical protein
MDGILTDINSPKLRNGLAYWNEKRGDRLMPARADLDPMEMIPFLPNVILIDVLREPLDFRWRLIGTIVEEHMSMPYTGRRFSEFEGQREGSRIWSCSERVLTERRPVPTDIPYIGPKSDFTTIQDVMMPLSSDGESVDVIFIVVEYVRKQPGDPANMNDLA